MTKKAKNELFSSILYIIVGAVLAIFQSQTLGWAMTIVGAFFIITGALDLIKQNWVGGGVSAAIGIAILVLGWLAVDIVLLVLGILMALKGIIALIEMLKKEKKNALELIFPVGTIALGLLLAFGRGLDIIILVVGILLAVDGVLGLLGAVQAMKKK